jgi:hypothetical protein
MKFDATDGRGPEGLARLVFWNQRLRGGNGRVVYDSKGVSVKSFGMLGLGAG